MIGKDIIKTNKGTPHGFLISASKRFLTN